MLEIFMYNIVLLYDQIVFLHNDLYECIIYCILVYIYVHAPLFRTVFLYI